MARCLTDRHIHPNLDGIWTYPRTTEVLATAGLFSIDDYIKRRRDTVRNFMIARPLYEGAEDQQPCLQRLFGGSWTEVD